MKYILLVCLLLHVAFAGYGYGSAGPYAKNSYAGAGYQGKHQADKIVNAKYAKNAVGAKQRATRLKKMRVNMVNANAKKMNRHHSAAAANNKVAKKNFANNAAARKARVKFHKNNAAKAVAFNKLKKKQNLMHNNLNAGNRLNRNHLNKKNANIKKVNNFAKHNEFDDNYDVDAGSASGGYHGSSGAGPKHVTRRKHGQQHAFGNKMMMSNFNQLNGARLNKKNFLNSNKAVNQKYIDAAKARMKNRRNNMAYAAAKNNFHKNSHYNAMAAAANKKRANSAANAFKFNKNAKNKAALAAAKKSSRYRKMNNIGAAARNAHTYGNQYSRKKAIGNIN